MKRFLALLSITIAVTSCGSSSSQSDAQKDAISVAASFYPIEEIVRRVGGTHVSVVGLTPAGEGAHDVQLTAKNLDELANASAVFYISDGFQPDVEKAVTSLP